MNVLFVSYQNVGLGNGGMYRQILNTKLALENNGINVVFHDFMRNNLDDIDICHVFGTHSSSHEVIKYCKRKKIPIVMTTVFNRFLKFKPRYKIEKIFSKHVPGFLNDFKSFYAISDYIDCYIALNAEEKSLLSMQFDIASDRVCILPNGVDQNLLDTTPTIKSGSLVLNVGVLNKNKNQYNLIKAAENQAWNLSIVGPIGDSTYANECLKLAKRMSNVTMHGELPYGSSKLIELYRNAKVFCLPSYKEVQPLTLLEAGGYNCSLVASENLPLQTFLERYTTKCAPSDPLKIRKAIEVSLKKNNNTWEIIRQQPAWNDVACNLIGLYKRVISDANR